MGMNSAMRQILYNRNIIIQIVLKKRHFTDTHASQ